MRPENIKEYELLRNEMVTVKECITKYLGYVLGGSGLSVYGMVTLVQGNLKPFFIALMSFAFAIIMSFVLLILFYKFSSHNRFAGYCKLLNHEDYNPPDSQHNTGQQGNPTHPNSQMSAFSWEIALERLRASDMNPATLTELVKCLRLGGVDPNQLTYLLGLYSGRHPQKDHGKFLKGLWILLKALFGKIQTRSWGFPPIVTSVFAIICGGFFLAGMIAIISTFSLDETALGIHLWLRIIVYIMGFVTTLSLFWLWYRFIGKLYCLMEGTSTVDGFFWRFLPIRAAFLNQLGIDPTYVFASDQLADEVANLRSQFGGLRDSWEG
jgi:hypothetical protein